MVTDGTVLQNLCLVCNEVGYASRMLDLADIVSSEEALPARRVRSPVSCWRSGRGLDEPEPPEALHLG